MSKPNKFWDIEQKLANHYLRSDGDFGAMPLSFLDASDEELARALEIESPEKARSEILHCFSSHGIKDVYATGSCLAAPRDIEAPGWFSYLVLSCVIASTTSEDSELGNFRERLSEQLNTTLVFSDLRGVAVMWKRLRDWCDERRNEQQPYRQINLPEPGKWSHIGYTLRIAFPSRRDVERISRHLTENRPDISKPLQIVRYVQDRIAVAQWSEAFVAAFSDFKRRVERGERILAQHPFFGALEKTLTTSRTSLHRRRCELRLTTDIDGQSTATIVFPNANSAVAAGISDGLSGSMGLRRLLKGLQDAHGLISGDDLGLSFQEGIIPFTNTEWGIWEFVRTPSHEPVRLLLRPDRAKLLNPSLRSEDHWTLTSGHDLKSCIELLCKSRPGFKSNMDTLIPRPSLRGGIRVGAHYLGLQFCLPTIRASGECNVVLNGMSDAVGFPSVERQDAANFVISSTTPLDGIWIAKVTERSSPVLDLKLKFTKRAFEHEPECYSFDPAKWLVRSELRNEVSQNLVMPLGSVNLQRPDRPFPEVLEAIYAGGASPWEESRIIPMLSKCLDKRISPWDALRLLADSGWLEPCVSASWRVTKWFLRQPRVVRLTKGHYILDGAHCEGIRARFCRASVDAGLSVGVIHCPGDWSVPSLLSKAIGPTAREPSFELPVVDASILLPPVGSPCDFRQSASSDRSRTVCSYWCWSSGRFRRGTQPSEDVVALERLQHNGDRAADLYRVRAPDGLYQYFDSRAVAICVANALNNSPEFIWDSSRNLLTRTTREGWLPRSLAEFVRLSAGYGPAILLGADTSVYAYPVDSARIPILAKWLGAAIDVGSKQPSARAMVLAKRLGVPRQLIDAGSLQLIGDRDAP